jgi:hypothetical protein
MKLPIIRTSIGTIQPPVSVGPAAGGVIAAGRLAPAAPSGDAVPLGVAVLLGVAVPAISL